MPAQMTIAKALKKLETLNSFKSISINVYGKKGRALHNIKPYCYIHSFKNITRSVPFTEEAIDNFIKEQNERTS